MWSSGGAVLQRMNNVSSTMMSNSLVYTNSYTISQLSTTDEGRVIQCEGVINASPLVTANNNIRTGCDWLAFTYSTYYNQHLISRIS